MDAHFLVAARLPKIPITSSLLEVRKKKKSWLNANTTSSPREKLLISQASSFRL